MNIKYSFKRTPMPHQVNEFLHHIKLERSATFSETGSGKTFPILAATDFRFKQGMIESCLYIAPNSILEKIAREVELSSDLKPLVLQGYSRQKRIKLIGTAADVHIINYEALQNYMEYLLKNKYDQIIFDEAHNLRNHSSNTSKAARALMKNVKYCLAATGTPLCSRPEDVFSLFKVLDPSVFGNRIGVFRDQFCQRVDKNIMRNGRSFTFQETTGFKPGSERRFRELVDSVSICNKKKDCLDLPDKVEENRRVELSTKIKKYYNQLKAGTLSEIGDTVFAMDSDGVKCQRASQVASGFLYYREDDKRKVFTISTSNKLKELSSILSHREDKKTAIWCKYKHSISMIAEEFKSMNPEVQRSNHNNQRSRDIFQTDPNCKLIISQLNICDGYELTASDCAVYFEMPYEYHKLKQSQDRIHRKGSEIHDQIMYYYLITRGTIEESILNVLQRKKDLSDVTTGNLEGVLRGTYGGKDN